MIVPVETVPSPQSIRAKYAPAATGVPLSVNAATVKREGASATAVTASPATFNGAGSTSAVRCSMIVFPDGSASRTAIRYVPAN